MKKNSREFYSIRLPIITEKTAHDSWYQDWDKHMEVIRKINKFPDVLVTKDSSIVLKRAMYKLALYFQREFGYDYIQYDINSKNNYIGYMWTDGTIVIGACLFWWSDEDECWRMNWAWFHPYLRDKKLLSESWNYFIERHGKFDVDLPLSNNMKAFLIKKKYEGPSFTHMDLV
jgi:hypothetical protein